MNGDLDNGKESFNRYRREGGALVVVWLRGWKLREGLGPFVQTCPTKGGWANQQPASKRGMERFLEALFDLTRGNVNKSKSQWDNSFQH